MVMLGPLSPKTNEMRLAEMAGLVLVPEQAVEILSARLPEVAIPIQS
jgi:hypothetical protein